MLHYYIFSKSEYLYLTKLLLCDNIDEPDNSECMMHKNHLIRPVHSRLSKKSRRTPTAKRESCAPGLEHNRYQKVWNS